MLKHLGGGFPPDLDPFTLLEWVIIRLLGIVLLLMAAVKLILRPFSKVDRVIVGIAVITLLGITLTKLIRYALAH